MTRTFAQLPALSICVQAKAWELGDWESALELKASPGMMVVTLPGSALKTKAALFKGMAKALEFPAYFGGNWDALDECLGDLRWMGAKELLLVIPQAGQVLGSVAKSEEHQIWWDLLAAAAKAKRLKGPKLRLLLVVKDRKEAGKIGLS